MSGFDGNKIGLTMLRVVLGGAFLMHALEKQPLAADATVQMFMMWGMPAPSFTAMLAIVIELVGGALLIAGIWVLPASLVLIGEMVVALWVVHWNAGFSFMQVQSVTAAGPVFGTPGWEVNVLYIAGFGTLALAEAPAWLARRQQRSIPAVASEIPAGS